MNEAQKEIDRAFQLLSTVPVRGDSVEIMAAAKQNLRRAFALSGSNPQEGDGEGG